MHDVEASMLLSDGADADADAQDPRGAPSGLVALPWCEYEHTVESTLTTFKRLSLVRDQRGSGGAMAVAVEPSVVLSAALARSEGTRRVQFLSPLGSGRAAASHRRRRSDLRDMFGGPPAD
mmetsp:Transcript_35267/g.65345  ORF Transcript_35267/g.65345 Transcript_35267/m.65345 type:complete len:121 (+) Transcript_35267:793-1155(+)